MHLEKSPKLKAERIRNHMVRIKADQSILLVIDVQGKLAGLMHDPDYLRHVQGMIKIAQLLEIPILVTEQAPEKIGFTVPEICQMLPEQIPIKKTSFSCCAEPAFMEAFKRAGRVKVIVTGIESHVCVYQTVRDLRSSGHDVFLVTDAVSSRAAHNAGLGIQRAKEDGAVLTSLEMMITDLIGSTGHPKFREIMACLKNG